MGGCISLRAYVTVVQTTTFLLSLVTGTVLVTTTRSTRTPSTRGATSFIDKLRNVCYSKAMDLVNVAGLPSEVNNKNCCNVPLYGPHSDRCAWANFNLPKDEPKVIRVDHRQRGPNGQSNP